MCIVYNTIGSLRDVKSHLAKNNVNDFKSIKELIDFQRNYSGACLDIISNHSIIIEQESDKLEKEIPELKMFIQVKRKDVEFKLLSELELLQQRLEELSSIHTNIFKAFINYFNRNFIKKKIHFGKHRFNSEVNNSVQSLQDRLNEMTKRYEFILLQFNDAVKESGKVELNALERKKKIIDAVNNSIYGAIGEQKVVKELEKLSDDYIVINDFRCSFKPPIYNSAAKDYIKSIQADHLLISPVGVFIIETKNWSEESLNSLSLRSPVEQIRRVNFALYRILNGEASRILDLHHWGQKKIPIKNLIVLINRKPREEFQHVKILTVNELENYLSYFQPIFSQREVKSIAGYLMRTNFKVHYS